MKVGDTRSPEAMQLVCSALEYERGRAVVRHVRNGRIVLERHRPEECHAEPCTLCDGPRWIVTECERPDQ